MVANTRVVAMAALLLAGWTSEATAQTGLLLFGGSGHRTFLGCLNCGQFDDGSICNEFGSVGSKFNSNSIWNDFGTFGSKFSQESPWNSFSTSAPVIVDAGGNSYGYLSANRFHPSRTQIRALVQLTDLVASGLSLDRARKLFCNAN